MPRRQRANTSSKRLAVVSRITFRHRGYLASAPPADQGRTKENPNRAGWVWVKSDDLIAAMRTFDTVENRGYLLVSEGE